MKTSSSIALLALSVLATVELAHADAVSDRVLLVPNGGSACGTGQQTFRRILQRPEGTETGDYSEFVVPSGKYLEITSVEYLPPYSGLWTKGYLQWIAVAVRPRTGGAGASVFRTRYQTSTVYAADGDDWEAVNENVNGDAHLQVASFPVGPLMGPTARLCVSAPSSFWTYAGSVRVRGRLIPSGDLAVGTVPAGSVAD